MAIIVYMAGTVSVVLYFIVFTDSFCTTNESKVTIIQLGHTLAGILVIWY